MPKYHTALTFKALFIFEREYRLSQTWWFFEGEVIADNGQKVKVEIKSYGFYNQILRVNGEPLNHAAGHSINRVKDMRDWIKNTINNAAEKMAA